MRNLIGIIVLLPTLAYAAQLINGNQVNPASDLAIHKVTVNTTDLVTDAVNHRVGIGTGAPKDTLHVATSGPGGIVIDRTDGSPSSGTIRNAGGSLNINYFNPAGSGIFFQTDSTTRLQIPQAGVTTGGALCLNASKTLSKCTSAVDASGNCTCP